MTSYDELALNMTVHGGRDVVTKPLVCVFNFDIWFRVETGCVPKCIVRREHEELSPCLFFEIFECTLVGQFFIVSLILKPESATYVS